MSKKIYYLNLTVSTFFAGFMAGLILVQPHKISAEGYSETKWRVNQNTNRDNTIHNRDYSIKTKETTSTKKERTDWAGDRESKDEVMISNKRNSVVKNIWWVNWYPSTFELYNKMRKLWYSDYNAKLIIVACKKYSFYPRWCVLTLASVWVAESSAFNNCYRNNCLWLYRWKPYKSIRDNVVDWVYRFNKYWYTFDRYNNPAHFFYSINWKPSRSRYCTEEASSWLKHFHCPNWYKHFKKAYLTLNK